MPHTNLGIPKIIFEDNDLLVAFKPANLLVHKTNFDFGEKRNLRNWISDYLGHEVHPVHRIDKPTLGLVLFSKQKSTTNFLQEQFVNHTALKKYVALVRGFTNEGGIIEKPLSGSEGGEIRACKTVFKKLCQIEIDQPVGRYATSRYSLVDIQPHTGRYHQIRLHFSHLRNPIIGDTRHGDLHHNKTFREVYEIPNLMLHSYFLGIKHPNGQVLKINCDVPEYWGELFSKWGSTEFSSQSQTLNYLQADLNY
jgi:tRNA pseudouridine65 synthase